MIALLSSMPFESERILSLLKNVRTAEIAGKTAYKGNLTGNNIVLMNTGIGKVNAAHSATCIIEHYKIESLINLGVGGAYPGAGLDTGDIAIAAAEIYGDDGVITSEGFKGMNEIGIPLVQVGDRKYFNEFPLHLIPSLLSEDAKDMSQLARKCREGLKKNFKIKTGNFVTVSATSGTQRHARELEASFNAVCENMEGAAIAHICAIYKIPLLEIRGISNIAGIRDKRKWDMGLASENCQMAVLEVISNKPLKNKKH